LTTSHSPRSLRDRTRREDRHLKFYELRDKLTLWAPPFVNAISHTARRSPKGADGVALYTSRATVMELGRALACAPQTASLAGKTGLGAPSWSPTAPPTDPEDRMVEPNRRGTVILPFWAQPFRGSASVRKRT